MNILIYLNIWIVFFLKDGIGCLPDCIFCVLLSGSIEIGILKELGGVGVFLGSMWVLKYRVLCRGIGAMWEGIGVFGVLWVGFGVLGVLSGVMGSVCVYVF